MRVRVDFAARVDELRCHTNEVLRDGVTEARRAQQRWRLEELAATRVLDERNALDRMPDRKESARTQRSKLEVARALEARPADHRGRRDPRAPPDTGRRGCARTVERKRSALPTDVERHVRRRDTTCRVPGCEATRNLQIHHTEPVCDFGDTHLVHKLAAVCPAHHRLLEPHGPYRLRGDAETPDGLRLERLPHPRDGPSP